DSSDPMTYFNRGNAFYDLREYQQAIDNYNQAITLDPDYSDAYKNRGATYSVLQEYGQAIDNYNHAISFDSSDPMTYFNRGNAFYDLREYQQAIDNYNQVISIDPTNMDAYYSRGRAYDELGEHETAIADYDRTTPIDPTIAIQIAPVDLGDIDEIYRGVYLKHYQGDGRNTYFSDFVPHALVWDLHEQIGETAQIIKTRLAVDIDHQPDLYLLGDKMIFNTVERFLNVASGGFEPAGFYKTPCGPNKFTSDKCYGGVYANLSSGDGDHLWLHRLIAHEYTHSMIDSALDKRAAILANWLNEGLAQWVENEVVPHDGGKAARKAAKADELFPLKSIESRKDWNSRQGTDVELQYSEAHMAVTYFIEEFGGSKLFELIEDSLRSGSIDHSIRALTGISYQEFESSFFSWLKASS
ncbi:MAG: tetratricopeptide repeat protein, partial [Chloroflexota bacterium]|nr:tetratricopeptide repeat protein [Chloroflexota bacterium]